ncbi:MAG: insulinase family protein, partial [Candidatus Lambdaproteobacteria bacterium]
MRKILTLFLAICFLAGASISVWGGGLNNTDSRYPQRQYRRFLLPNQMKVMLISDPTLQRGAASLTVAVGSMSDPSGRSGLAHFLEHMLFLGTEKYPDEGSYQEFVSTHDGFSNAYTAN